jgi:5-keto 4-deoxyuronate isomerase
MDDTHIIRENGGENMKKIVEFLNRREVQVVCAGIVGYVLGWATFYLLEKRKGK